MLKLRKQTNLKYVTEADINSTDGECEDIKAMARYLYWACFRGDNEVVKYLLETIGISPFY